VPGRLELLAVLVTAAGAVLCARGGLRLARVIRARFTLGAPYREGMIADRALGLLLEAPVLLLGLALGFLALAQAGFQDVSRTVRAAQVQARRSGWGRTHVRVVPDPLYPAQRVLEGEISGARWAIVGDFVTWTAGIRWLGLRDGHRFRLLLGTNDTTGLTPAARADRQLLDTLPWAARRLAQADPYLPFVRVQPLASSWFPIAEHQVLVLYATGAGYLADSAAAGTAPSRDILTVRRRPGRLSVPQRPAGPP
jgi:hypothetical protein